MNRWPIFGAALIALVVYLPSLSNGFALDDVGDIVENPVVQPNQNPLDVVLSPYRSRVPRARSPYRPLTSLTFWGNGLAGSDAWGFHMTNVLLHALATGLVTALLLALGASAPWSLVGGTLFAVHPVHVEAVANIVGRGDVLMTVFTLVAVLTFLDRSSGLGRRALGVAVAYALALLSKENGVALPGLLAAIALLAPYLAAGGLDEAGVPAAGSGNNGSTPTPARSRFVEDCWVIAPTLLVLVGYFALRYQVLGTFLHSDTAPYIAALTGFERTTTAIANFAHLGRLLVLPWDLVVDYGPDVITPVGILSLRFAAGAVLLGLGVIGALKGVRSNTRLVLALLWIAIPTFVVSNLVFGIGVWVAERTLYLPSVGVSIGIVALATFLKGAGRLSLRRGFVGLLTVAGLVGAWRTTTRIPSFMDTDAVFSTLADEHPESFRSQWWLARRLTDSGDPVRGLDWFDRAIQTSPNDYRLRLDRVRALLLAGRAVEAQQAATALPGSDPARFVYLAQSHIMQERAEDARAVVHAGLMVFPRDARLLRQAGELDLAPGQRD